MGLNASDEELQLAGAPAGLVAYALREHRRGVDGELVEVKNRRGQRKTDRVELAPTGALTSVEIEPSEERWLLDADQRRWAGIQSRYGERAWTRAVELTRAGVVRLRCAVDDRLALAEPQGWTLTDAWQARRSDTTRLRDLERDDMRRRASVAADAVAARCPQLASALRAAAPASPTTSVLVFAAEDLVEGVMHAGPRAFSQAHYEHTKVREDVARVLTDAGVPDDVLVELGIRRSARIGVAGAVRASVDGEEVALDLLDGPVLLRIDQRGLRLSLINAVALVVVENLQAAETLADQVADIALIYTAGLPGQPALRLIAGLAEQASRVLVVPDADLGGVRIAEAVLSAAPAGDVVDVGELEHPPRDPWPTDGVSMLGLHAALSGRAGTLARACLSRGYPVEQELATISAVRRHLA
ncbi:MAG: DUF2399 domain-containing protein [Actinomycetota bacterium]|nr:DUF2399 domain-containing protein [Actinomycetota bacterium]